MVGYSEGRKLVAAYRVDRNNHPTVTEEPVRKWPAHHPDCLGQTFSMYFGEESKVELLCENALMGSIIDRFGEDVAVQSVDRERFKVTAAVAPSINYGWVFTSGGKMRILDPEKVTTQFQAVLNNFLV